MWAAYFGYQLVRQQYVHAADTADTALVVWQQYVYTGDAAVWGFSDQRWEPWLCDALSGYQRAWCAVYQCEWVLCLQAA